MEWWQWAMWAAVAVWGACWLRWRCVARRRDRRRSRGRGRRRCRPGQRSETAVWIAAVASTLPMPERKRSLATASWTALAHLPAAAIAAALKSAFGASMPATQSGAAADTLRRYFSVTAAGSLPGFMIVTPVTGSGWWTAS